VSDFLDLSTLPSGERERILTDLFSEGPAMSQNLPDLSTVTDAELVDTLRAVIAEDPDHVYTVPEHMQDGKACYYVHEAHDNPDDLTPGCVVGVVLDRFGVPLDVLHEREGENAATVLRKFFPKIRNETTDLFTYCQNRQDRGDTWAAALKYAESDCE
jgi:porphobilinogen deaminase